MLRDSDCIANIDSQSGKVETFVKKLLIRWGNIQIFVLELPTSNIIFPDSDSIGAKIFYSKTS